MAFDLVIGKSARINDGPVFFGSIEYDEHISLLRLQKRHPSWLMERLTNIYQDQAFSLTELEQAAEQIDAIIQAGPPQEDLPALYKLSAAVSMAIRMGMPLWGVAD